MTSCPECSDWKIAEEDIFCGGCGAFVAPLRITIARRMISTGAAPCLLLADTVQDELAEVPFAMLSVVGDQEIEVARAFAGEFPEGMLVPLEHSGDHALRVRAIRNHGKDEAPQYSQNILAESVFRSSNRIPSVTLANPMVDCRSAAAAGEGWHRVAVSLRSTGTPIIISSARLRIDGELAGEDDPENLEPMKPILLGEGSTVTVGALISDAELAAVLRETRMRSARIDLQIIEDEDPVDLVVAQRARVYSADLPGMTLALARRIRGRAGQRARIGASIHNIGGEPLLITSVVADFAGKPLPLDLPIAWNEPIEPGETRRTELRPELPAVPGRGALTVRITATANASLEELVGSATRDAEVVDAERQFEGWICIDLGTSESGAAARPDGSSYPIVIDLGNAPLEHDPLRQEHEDRLGRFLPTIIAQMEDDSFRIGRDASAMAHAFASLGEGKTWPAGLDRPVQIISEFKWLLDRAQPDQGERGQLLVTEYLKVVRELIENHPDIAAQIGPNTRVSATRPTIFDEGRSDRLFQAFQDAGFNDPRVPLFGSESGMIAESWSPLPLVMRAGSLKRGDFTKMTKVLDERVIFEGIPPPNDPKRDRAPAWLVVCDIGAGSADFSVFEMVAARGRLQMMHERAFATDLDFAGRRFAEFIGDVLVEWIESSWKGGSKTHDPQELREAVGATDTAEAHVRSVFSQTVRHLQFNPGMLSEGLFAYALQEAFGEFLTNEQAGKIEAAIEEAFGKGGEARRAARAYLPIEFHLPDGDKVILDSNNLAGLVCLLSVRFMERYGEWLRDYIESLLESSGLRANIRSRADAAVAGPASLVRIIPSGRGGAFPLAWILIRAVFDDLAGLGATFALLTPVAAKSITSWGGLDLASCIDDPLLTFQIAPPDRPFSLRVRVGRAMGSSDYETLPFVAASQPAAGTGVADRKAGRAAEEQAAAVSMLDVFYAHVDLESADELQIEELDRDGTILVHRLDLPEAIIDEVENWWLCATRTADGTVRIDYCEAETIEAAIAAFLAERSAHQ